jgi:hypothetical protein
MDDDTWIIEGFCFLLDWYLDNDSLLEKHFGLIETILWTQK